MSKFLNESDFFMCSGGMMPARMKSSQVVVSKKNEVKYIRIVDVQTTSFGDFVCKKLMLLMAVAAVLFALLCAVTGGAALIAAAAIGGAVGAAAGALICGYKAAAARKWLMPKEQVYIAGQKALTDSSYMVCMAVGTEQIRLAPHIKNWWQALAVGVTNFAGEMFKCIMVGAAAAGGLVILTEGIGAFLSNAAANYLLTLTSASGLALRGGLGVMEGVQDKYVKGESTADAFTHGFGSAVFGLEQGTMQSMGNIVTGQGRPEDFAGLLAWGAPIAPAEEAAKPIDADAMGNGGAWEGKPQSGNTGFLDSPRMSRAEIQEYQKGLNEQGIDFAVDKKGVLPEGMRGGFNNETGTVYLRKGATHYEAFHEAQHAKQWKELGKEAYQKQTTAEKETYVYDQIAKNKDQFSQAELEHAEEYVNGKRADEGLPPVMDAMEGGSPAKGADGDVFEDPAAVKENAKKQPTEEEMAALKAQRRQMAEDFYLKHNPGKDADAVASELNGIDFSKPVSIVKIPPDGLGPKGNELHQFTKVNTEGEVLRGQYYTDNPANTPSELGISDKYNVRDKSWKHTDEVRTVQQEKVVFDENKPIEGLKSTSKEIDDSWSLKDGQKVPTKGGGSQIYIPKNQ
ncbi:hypothetical protein GCM10027037_26750 [Mucilaginibacter koreensis]